MYVYYINTLACIGSRIIHILVEEIYLYCTIPQGPAKKAEPCRSGNHSLQCELNNLNADKIPAQW